MTDVELNIKGLDALLKALKGKLPQIRVGVLGKAARSGGGPSNAEIGASHEFGTSKLPQRSFLRIPLMTRLNKELIKSGALDKETVKEIIKTGSFKPFATKVAIVAEDVVLGAFDTGGYGAWPPSNMRNKKVEMTLVETQQLRNSITSEVKD